MGTGLAVGLGVNQSAVVVDRLTRGPRRPFSTRETEPDSVSSPPDPQIWGPPDRPLELVARNVSTRYLAIFIDGVIGLVLLPFNVSHLGPAAYGLWALTTSVTWFFGVLDLGYGSALVKFIAQYRAWRDRNALNEILSTIGMVFTGLGVLCFLVTAVIAWRVGSLFNIEPDQVRTAQSVLLIVGAYLSVRFALSIFGAVVYGFQRYYLNNVVSIGISLVVAGVNLGVLGAGTAWSPSWPHYGCASALARPVRVERVPGVSRHSGPAVAVSAGATEGSDRLQRLHARSRLVGKAELLVRHHRDRRDARHDRRRHLDGRPASGAGRAAIDQPAERRVVSERRRQRRRPASRSAADDPVAGHQAVARPRGSALPRADRAGRTAHSQLGRPAIRREHFADARSC